MKSISFEFTDLTEQDVNLILGAVYERPFKDVVQLVNKLNAQVQQQVAKHNSSTSVKTLATNEKNSVEPQLEKA